MARSRQPVRSNKKVAVDPDVTARLNAEKAYTAQLKNLASNSVKTSGWSQKYVSKHIPRIMPLISKAAKNFDGKVTSLNTIKMPTTDKSMGIGWMWEATTDTGKKYYIETPHSPGGKLYDIPTQGVKGWNSLGSGELGGDGNYKMPKATGASWAAVDDVGGLENVPNPYYAKNINVVKEGVFGNPLLDMIGSAAASYFGGPIGAGLYAAAGGGDVKDVLGSAALTWAGGKLTGTGAGADGGSWYSPAGDITNPFGSLGSSTAGLPVDQVSALNPTDPNAWLSNVAGDVASSSNQIAQSITDSVMNLDPLAGLGSAAGSFTTGSSLTDLLNANNPLTATGTGGLDNLANEVISSGGSYVDPWSAGSITGVSGLGSLGSGALGNISGITGMDTTGIASVPAEIATPEKSYWDTVGDRITSNPLDAAKLAVGGAGLLDTLSGGKISEALDGLLGTGQESSGSTYKPKPIDRALVDKYSRLSNLGNLRYQQFGNLALPQGLLDARLQGIG